MRRNAGRFEKGRHPVHRHRMLARDAARLDACRPACDVRHPDAPFEEIHLLADERPVIREALAAVVAREDDQRVALGADRRERLEYPADAFVHLPDHRQVRGKRAAIRMHDARDAPRFRFVLARFPRPVRRRVVEREKERRLALPANEIGGSRGDQIGEVTGALDLRLAVIEVVATRGVTMGEVIDAAAHWAEKLHVAALQRAEAWRKAEMALADERGGVAGIAQQRRERRMLGRQPEHRALTRRAAGDRLVGAAAQPVLPAASGEREARRRAHRRVGVAVGEAQARGRQPIHVGRAGRASAVAAEIGVAEIVGQDEDEVGAQRYSPLTPVSWITRPQAA